MMWRVMTTRAATAAHESDSLTKDLRLGPTQKEREHIYVLRSADLKLKLIR